MKDFKKAGGFRKNFDRNRESKPLYEATCSDCSKRCEVPFRPANGRPIYCRDCFGGHSQAPRDREQGGFKKPFKPFAGGPMGDRRERSQMQQQPAAAPRADGAQLAAQTRALELLNEKMDRLIAAVEAQRTIVEAPAAVESNTAHVAKVVKRTGKPGKSAAKRKK